MRLIREQPGPRSSTIALAEDIDRHRWLWAVTWHPRLGRRARYGHATTRAEALADARAAAMEYIAIPD